MLKPFAYKDIKHCKQKEYFPMLQPFSHEEIIIVFNNKTVTRYLRKQ
jgi:hypothetical protein